MFTLISGIRGFAIWDIFQTPGPMLHVMMAACGIRWMCRKRNGQEASG